MADVNKKLPANVPGEFFVDSTCINCDTCRQLAPATFGETDDYSYVQVQPATSFDRRSATRALLSCPTGSIGVLTNNDSHEVVKDFPLELESDLYYCGFNSPKSYGGNSYFLRHKDGNWLIDSPKFVMHLVQQFHKLGGIRYIFLTHRDDVAEAQRYAAEFGASRIIHEFELSSQPEAEVVLRGDEPTEISEGFFAIPTPGHTQGHCVLLHDSRLLFTGDHLWWDRDEKSLGASRSVCWYSWSAQKRSMRRLLDYNFEWVLPGHGDRIHLPHGELHAHLLHLVDQM